MDFIVYGCKDDNSPISTINSVKYRCAIRFISALCLDLNVAIKNEA